MTNLLELAEFVRVNLRVPVQGDTKQLILTLSLNKGRTQTVLISLKKLSEGQLIEVRSRCGVISDSRSIRASLKRNLITPLGGVTMEKVDGHHVVDCVQRLVVPPGLGVNIVEFLDTITSVGVQADLIESKLGHADVF